MASSDVVAWGCGGGVGAWVQSDVEGWCSLGMCDAGGGDKIVGWGSSGGVEDVAVAWVGSGGSVGAWVVPDVEGWDSLVEMCDAGGGDEVVGWGSLLLKGMCGWGSLSL